MEYMRVESLLGIEILGKGGYWTYLGQWNPKVFFDASFYGGYWYSNYLEKFQESKR